MATGFFRKNFETSICRNIKVKDDMKPLFKMK